MKHIFKKLHFGSGHDPARASSPPATPPPSCACDHRRHAGGSVPSPAPAVVPPSPPPSPGDGPAARPAAAAERPDSSSSSEEFQVQLALAISASNSEFREDPDNDQIRAATLLSLGKQRTDPAGEEEGAAEVLSRRYWEEH